MVLLYEVRRDPVRPQNLAAVCLRKEPPVIDAFQRYDHENVLDAKSLNLHCSTHYTIGAKDLADRAHTQDTPAVRSLRGTDRLYRQETYDASRRGAPGACWELTCHGS